MKLTFKRAKWYRDDEGTWISLCVKESIPMKRFIADMKEKEYSAELKECRKPRSLNANSYAWQLMGQIADSIGSSKDEVYLTMLGRYGQCGAVSIEERHEEKFKRAYQYHEEIGRATLDGW